MQKGVLLSVLLILGWITAAFAASPEEVVIQLRWHHQFQFAGYYAALEKGFYREEGLQVRLQAGEPKRQPVAEVLSGRAQYAEGNAEILYQRLLGKPLVALAAIFQHSPSVLLVRKDSGIQSVHDLVGRKVMLMNMTEDADFLTMFLNEGIALSQVGIMPSSYDLNDLITGKVAAFNSYTTNEPFFLKQRNIPYTIIDPSNYRVDFYSDILFTSEAELRENPGRVEAVRRATLKGWRYAMDNPDEIIDLLLKKYQVQKSREHLEFEATEMRKLILPHLIEIGHMNIGRWQHMADTFVKAGLVRSNYSLDGFLYDATPRRVPRWVFPAFVGAFFALATVIVVAYYLLRLNRQLARAQGTLQESEERLRLALGAANQGWFDLDVCTGQVSVSADYARLLGYDASEFRTTLEEWKSGIHPDDREAATAAFKECLASGGPTSIEYRRRGKDGQWVWLNSVGKIIAWGAQRQPLRMIGIHTDVSERKRLELELVRQAHIDYLTGVSNRRWFMEQAEQELGRAIRYGSELSVLMMDVDLFKQTNDRYGHKVGDMVLRKLADVCRETLREVDVIGRLGGEEFAILLPETGSEAAAEAAERLRAAIAEARVPLEGGLPLSFTVSIGVAALASHDDNVDVLLNLADTALYAAKNAGRNRVCSQLQ